MSLQNIGMWQANTMLIFNTWEVYENVLKWAYACALVPDCIEPNRLVECHFGLTYVFTAYAKCHRFDQSIINILLSNWWHNNPTQYKVPLGYRLVDISRYPTHDFVRHWCHPSNKGDRYH